MTWLFRRRVIALLATMTALLLWTSSGRPLLFAQEGAGDPNANVEAQNAEVSIGNVVRGSGLPYSVPPGKTATVTVTLTPSPLPAGQSITIAVINGNADNGTATIEGAATLTASGSVTVKGGDQTGEGKGGNLKLQAKDAGGAVAATSNGFSVCAHPTDFSTSRIADVNGASVGVKAENEWTSDSGDKAHLDKAERSEVIAEGPRTDPPFTLGGGGIVSGYIAGDAAATTDTHSYPKARIAAGPAGTNTYLQLFKFKCARCGAADKAVPKSGFKIVHEVKKNAAGNWEHTCTKSGDAVTIGGLISGAGDGSATSDAHAIP